MNYWSKELIGCGVGEASILCEQADHILRIVKIAGEDLAQEADAVFTRVNVEVDKDNIVTECFGLF